ncbi:MAG TPA: hypothetical protein VID27_03135 [Blastocatellia bacterium]
MQYRVTDEARNGFAERKIRGFPAPQSSVFLRSVSIAELRVKQYAEAMKGETEKPFYEAATREEWLKAFNEWVNSHDLNTTVIEHDSREAIYGDDGR